MSPWFPAITRSAWWLATLGGALEAYILGYLPTTLMSMGEQTSQAPPAEPPQWIVLLLAAGLGLAAGAVLSFAQWLALRKHVHHAGLWIPANMLAWAAGHLLGNRRSSERPTAYAGCLAAGRCFIPDRSHCRRYSWSISHQAGCKNKSSCIHRKHLIGPSYERK